MKIRLLSIVLAFALVAVACGGDAASTGEMLTDDGTAETTPMTTAPAQQQGASSTTAAETPTTASAAASIESDLPAVNVVNLADGSELTLNTLATGETPLLLWFWAPH